MAAQAQQATTAVTNAIGEGNMDWLQNAAKGPLKKVTYQVLEWVNKILGKETPPPGNTSKQETTQGQFLDYLKDGNVLAQLANTIKPGVIPPPPPTPQEQIMSNIKGFLNFAEKDAGVPAAQQVKAEEVAAAKPSAFQPLLNTLVGLGGNASEKFNLDTIKNMDLKQLNAMATLSTGKSFMDHLTDLKNRIFKPRAAAVEQPAAAAQ